jgi:hypothetical protein
MMGASPPSFSSHVRWGERGAPAWFLQGSFWFFAFWFLHVRSGLFAFLYIVGPYGWLWFLCLALPSAFALPGVVLAYELDRNIAGAAVC